MPLLKRFKALANQDEAWRRGAGHRALPLLTFTEKDPKFMTLTDIGSVSEFEADFQPTLAGLILHLNVHVTNRN